MNILDSTRGYEEYLRHELGEEVIEDGLREKRKEMASGPFPFLRATYWRWAETVPHIAPPLANAPHVLAVGDIHLENFGTWRDADGRLVWGVNDYDEAAVMPYAFDLLRLTVSALLAGADRSDRRAPMIAGTILDGYRIGLRKPRAFILDRESAWLRMAVIVPEGQREDFWQKLEKKREIFERQPAESQPPLWRRYREALAEALPPGAGEPKIWYRSAGLGSLGRPRWVAQAEWNGDWVVREAKAIVPSAWTRTHTRHGRAPRCSEIASGRYRAPDPWFRFVDGVAVRRLSPNNRKIGVDQPSKQEAAAESTSERKLGLDFLLGEKMLKTMGKELAAVHLGTSSPSTDAEIKGHVGNQDSEIWLRQSAIEVAGAIRDEQAAFRKSWKSGEKRDR